MKRRAVDFDELAATAAKIVGCDTEEEHPAHDGDLSIDEGVGAGFVRLTFNRDIRRHSLWITEAHDEKPEPVPTAPEVRKWLAQIERALIALQDAECQSQNMWIALKRMTTRDNVSLEVLSRFWRIELPSPLSGPMKTHTHINPASDIGTLCYTPSVKQWKSDVQVIESNIRAQDGRPKKTINSKVWAAESALELFREYGSSSCRPAQHDELTQLLYSRLTGDEDADLKRICRNVRQAEKRRTNSSLA